MSSSPVYTLRIQAVVTGTPGLSNEFGVSDLAAIVADADQIYQNIGIRFSFNPATDITEESGLGLQHDANIKGRLAYSNLYHGKIVIFFRDVAGGFSGPNGNFAAMPKGRIAGKILPHELGHYFHLRHTFGAIELKPATPGTATNAEKIADLLRQQKNTIKAFVDDQGHPAADGLKVFDGDLPEIGDSLRMMEDRSSFI